MEPKLRPIRRPLESRPRAPLPPGRLGRRKGPIAHGVEDLLLRLSEALYPLPPGLLLRRRLERGLVFSEIELRIGRGGPGLHGLRIAYVSDLHAGSFMTERDLCRIFERVARLEPDLVCLGGDLIEHRPEQVLLLGKALSLLRPPMGMFAVPGNHECDVEPGLGLWRGTLEEHGVEILINAGRRLRRNGESLWLAGVDDLSLGQPDLAAALREAREEEPILLLAHHPDLFHEASYVGVDLTLSGHTHAGQITFFGQSPLRRTRLGYWHGRFEKDGAQLYVSGGAGTTWLPIRMSAPGEVPLIRLLTSD